tara:strand:- start:58229 stop:58846 length:618 start_codon:yes stop_codon:yes gene_type:complete
MKFIALVSLLFILGCSHKHLIKTEQVKEKVTLHSKEQFLAKSQQAFRIGELIVSSQKNYRSPRPLLVVINVENLFYKRNSDLNQINDDIAGLSVDWDFAPGSLSLLKEMRANKLSAIFYCTKSLKCETYKSLLNVTGSFLDKWKFVKITKESDYQVVSNKIKTSEPILYMSDSFLTGLEFSQSDKESLIRSWIVLPERIKEDLTF